MPSCEPSHQYGTWIHLAKGTGYRECAAHLGLAIRLSHCKSLGWLVHELGEVGSLSIPRVSGGHQVNAVLDLTAVLSLGQNAQCTLRSATAWDLQNFEFLRTRVHVKVSCLPKPPQKTKEPLVVHKLGGARSQGIIKVGQVVFTTLIHIKTWQCMGRDQHRKDGTCVGEVNTGTMAPVPANFALKPHNSVNSCLSLAPSENCPSVRDEG